MQLSVAPDSSEAVHWGLDTGNFVITGDLAIIQCFRVLGLQLGGMFPAQGGLPSPSDSGLR